MLAHVLDFVAPRLDKQTQSLGRKWSIPFTDDCLLEGCKSIRRVTAVLERRNFQFTVNNSNQTFGRLTIDHCVQ